MTHQHHHSSKHRHQHAAHGDHNIAAHEHGSPNEIAQYLTDLAAAIRSNGVQIRVGERLVGMRLADQLTFDLQAIAQEGETQQIGLLLGWQSPKPPTKPAPILTITPLPPESAPGQPAAGSGEQRSDMTEGQPRPLPREDDTLY